MAEEIKEKVDKLQAAIDQINASGDLEDWVKECATQIFGKAKAALLEGQTEWDPDGFQEEFLGRY